MESFPENLSLQTEADVEKEKPFTSNLKVISVILVLSIAIDSGMEKVSLGN
jgi:hypothetical protein